MKKFICLFLLITLCTVFSFSQKPVKVKGTAQVEFPDNLTREEVKKKAVEMATIDALERAFGRVVIQGNTTYLSNIQTGKQIETKSAFNTIANTSVRGEVLKVIGDPVFTELTGSRTIDGKKESYTEMKCDIEIEAKEVTTPPVNFTAFTLNRENEESKTSDFKLNEKLYLYFSSPSTGYISVFLDEDNMTQCLYPYHTMPSDYEGGVPVAADKEYIIFSRNPKFDYFPGKKFVTMDCLMYTDEPRSINRLFIVFSKQPLNKPSLIDTSRVESAILPRSLKSEDFQRWLNRYRSYEKANVEVDYIDITITR